MTDLTLSLIGLGIGFIAYGFFVVLTTEAQEFKDMRFRLDCKKSLEKADAIRLESEKYEALILRVKIMALPWLIQKRIKISDVSLRSMRQHERGE